jgi:outer membrane protein TolC
MLADTNAVNKLESVVQTKQAMFQRGLLPYSLVLIAKSEQQLLAIDATQTKLQQMISLVNVYQNLGGGYKYSTESEGNENK